MIHLPKSNCPTGDNGLLIKLWNKCNQIWDESNKQADAHQSLFQTFSFNTATFLLLSRMWLSAKELEPFVLHSSCANRFLRSIARNSARQWWTTTLCELRRVVC